MTWQRFLQVWRLPIRMTAGWYFYTWVVVFVFALKGWTLWPYALVLLALSVILWVGAFAELRLKELGASRVPRNDGRDDA